jgi:hypothetical protein
MSNRKSLVHYDWSNPKSSLLFQSNAQLASNFVLSINIKFLFCPLF